MGSGGEDYSNVADGGQVNVTHPMHSSQHEDGGSDEIGVAGLSGVLADKQDADKLQGVDVSAVAPTDAQVMIYDAGDERWEATDHPAPNAHKASHQNGGSDEISVVGLDGLLADDQHVLDAEVLAVASDLAHAARHQNGGADEISLAGLDGESAGLATHKAVKAANATLGHVIVETAGLIDVDGDGKLTLGAHASLHQNGQTDEINVGGLSGELADDQPPKAHKAGHAGGGADKLKYTRQIMWYLPDATLATGVDKSATIVYRGPTLTLVRWDARVKTAPTDADLILDVLAGGTSLWVSTPANRPTIADAATSGTGTSFDDAGIADGDVLTFDVDQLGSTIPGGYVTLILEGEANLEAD